MDKLEEVKKLKKLLDDGIIDEDDFKRKKEEILGLSKETPKKEEIKEETKVEIKASKTKSKSLDDYEKEGCSYDNIYFIHKDESDGSTYIINLNEDFIKDLEDVIETLKRFMTE